LSVEEVETTLAKLLPEGVSFALSDPRAEADGLLPEELAHIARAVPKRKREFAAGRRAARVALAKLGQGPQPILAAPSRAPVWPEGFIGSISHCDDICIAICAHLTRFTSLGCDVEELAPMSDAVAEAVTTPRERDWLKTQDALQPVHVFSAKEALYKALFPVTARMTGFADVTILPDGAGGVFGELVHSQPPFAAGQRFTLLSASLQAHVLHMCFIS